ncbi:MAG TPA: hypothetical protein V6D47_17055, partial [Oscillatoriaceae cyanobacterium]
MSAPLAEALRAAVRAAAERESWPPETSVPIDWQPGPARRGDIATPIAFAIAKRLGKPAPIVAQAIAATGMPPGVAIEAAGGFLNLTLSDSWCAARLAHLLPEPPGAPERELRLVLADGPLTLGQARLAVLASVLERLLVATEGPIRLRVDNAGDRQSLLETLGLRSATWHAAAQVPASLVLDGQTLELGDLPESAPNWRD